MKTKLLSLILIFAMGLFFSQERISYKNKQNTISFKISEHEYYITFSENERSAIEAEPQNEFQRITNNSAIIKVKNLSGNFVSRRQELKNKKSFSIEKIEPVLIYEDGTKQMLNGQINIKVKPKTDINGLVKKWNLTIEDNIFEKDLYLLSSNIYSTEEIFSIVTELQNNKEIEFAEPNFIRLITPHTNDPYFNSQWAIKNQGYNGGTVGADMKVENAWNYATGNGIKVAIIDEGVDLNHPDLLGNLLPGYDATGYNSGGAPSGNDAHGTACAGIVASVANNNIGTVGIAYNTKIIPVRIAYSSNGNWIAPDNTIANGINWAWQNGADVLSNSWGGGSNSSTIVNAINNAVTNGRNGKGSIVLFSSGNDNTAVSFPANQSNVIAVGASNMFDERKSPNTAYHDECWYLDCHGGSNFGSEIDVVAPGTMIATSDISGISGYSSGDYYSYFNGTSSACPNVAGVVALILSVNPNLTQAQARAYLEKNTDKVLPNVYSYQSNSSYSNGTWNNQMGYGRVNALKAVEDVFFANVSLNGNNSTCNSQQTYTLSQVPNNITPLWTYSNNLTKNNETPSSITVTPNTNVSGSAFVKATFGTKEIVKNIWLGRPSANVVAQQGTSFWDLSLSDPTNNNFTTQNITSVTWTKISGNGVVSGNGLYAEVNGSPTVAWTITIKISITNSCGTTEIIKKYSNPDPDHDPHTEKIYTVSPNPTDDFINIELKDKTKESNQDVYCELYDLMGNSKSNTKTNNNKATISVKGINKGIYILRIYINDKIESHQIIVK